MVRRGHGEIMYRVPRGGALATTTTTPAERWLHRYRGGWQMLFPNVGDDSRIADVEYAFNGGVDQVEWEFTGDERRVVGSCVVHGSRISRTYGFAGARALEVLTVVENSTEAPLPYLWSEHPAFLAHDDATVESDAGWVEALLTSVRQGDALRQRPMITADDRNGAVRVVLGGVAALSRVLSSEQRRPFEGRVLTGSQLSVLFFLARTPAGLTPRQLAELLDVTAGAVTQLVDALKAEEHVEIRVNPDDARSRIIFLSGTARDEVEEFERATAERLEHQFASLTSVELTTLAELINRVTMKEQ